MENPNPGDDGSLYDPPRNTVADNHPAVPSTTTLSPAFDTPRCDRIQINYKVAPAIICAMCFIFGILYTFFGYRFFKATMFLTGFIFGSVLTYLICLEENLLPVEGKIGVALAAGVLCGLITMLVQYVGLFMTGLHFGLLLAIGSLVTMEQFYHPDTKWIPIGVLFGCGLLFALSTLYFQKGLTILGTSIFGAALMVTAVDYYTELFLMLHYVWDRVKAEPEGRVCWFSWIILGLWPLVFVLGTITQWRLTGKGFDHHEVVRSRRQKKVNLERARQRDRRSETQSQYRHLYQVRRSNGDVIAQVNM